MVKHSTEKLLNKYPYFLKKTDNSNLYKVTKVNNSVFWELYNTLFQVYEASHLRKRLLTWRDQSAPYVYETHFQCNYPNIKSVEIYKNDVLIHRELFSEEEEKTGYDWTYYCRYVKTNMLPVKVYKCLQCGDLYFGDKLPFDGCNTCNGNKYQKQSIYHCNTCDEYHFTNSSMSKYNLVSEEYSKVSAYKCGYCGQLHISKPSVCEECGTHDDNYTMVEAYQCNTCGTLFDNLPSIEGMDSWGDDDFTLCHAYLCLGHETEAENSESYGQFHNNCGEIYIGALPPSECKICGVEGTSKVTKLYTNDDSIIVDDNSLDYTDNEIIQTTGETINPIDDTILINNTNTTETDTGETLNIPFPVIPDDRFLFVVETWDEYYVAKGYPENDVRLDDEYDHDYSLDEFGALNNIPRKTYKLVEEKDYPLTEPPYNKQLTEDDYHYMNRMIEYNQRLWKDGENPVSLELWKTYSVPSELINRERYLLKLFDVDKHSHGTELNQINEYDNFIKTEYTDYEYEINENKKDIIKTDLTVPSTTRVIDLYIIGSDNEKIKNPKITYKLKETNTKTIKYGDENGYLRIPLDNTSNSNILQLTVSTDNNVSEKLYVSRTGCILGVYELNLNEITTSKDITITVYPLKNIISNPVSVNTNNLYYDKWYINTNYVGDWIPREWEHKDIFCDGTLLYGEYFFVEAETLTPIPYENVDFNFTLLNGHGERLQTPTNYKIDLYKYYNNDKGNHNPNYKIDKELKDLTDLELVNYYTDSNYFTNITLVEENIPFNQTCTLHSSALESLNPCTLLFICKNQETNEYIGYNEITLYPRNCKTCDIYVGANNTDKQDGSCQHPYTDLQVALDKVNRNRDVIGVKNDITINKPLTVSNPCKIIGCKNNNCDTATVTPPTISNTTSPKFFNIIGGKNCSLKITGLNLKSNTLESYIKLGTWINNNHNIENYQSISIASGIITLTVEFETTKTKFYPIEDIPIKISFKNNRGELVKNQSVNLYYDGEFLGKVTDTDGTGVIHYILNSRKYETGEYLLEVELDSDGYYANKSTLTIPCTLNIQDYMDSEVGERINIKTCSNSYVNGKSISVYDNNVLIATLTITNGCATLTNYQVPFGLHEIIFKDENGNIVDEAVVTSALKLSALTTANFIKNFNISSNGDITYDTYQLNKLSKLNELNGILLDLELDNVSIEMETYTVSEDKADNTELSYEESEIIKKAITDITYNSNGDIKFTRLGEIWNT